MTVEEALHSIIEECEEARKTALRTGFLDHFELGKAYAYSIISIYCYKLLADINKEK